MRAVTITPAQAEALRIIRTETVFYEYRKLKPSVNRPVPVTSRDLTPKYSHGLNARTVEALITKNLVTMQARDERHGVIVPVTDDEEGEGD